MQRDIGKSKHEGNPLKPQLITAELPMSLGNCTLRSSSHSRVALSLPTCLGNSALLKCRRNEREKSRLNDRSFDLQPTACTALATLSKRRSGVVPVTGARGQPTELDRHHIFLVCPARDNPQCLIRQRSLQPLGLIPRRAHPDVALLIGR